MPDVADDHCTLLARKGTHSGTDASRAERVRRHTAHHTCVMANDCSHASDEPQIFPCEKYEHTPETLTMCQNAAHETFHDIAAH